MKFLCVYAFVLLQLVINAPVRAADSAHHAHSPPAVTDQKAALDISQAAIGKTLSEHVLMNSRGQAVRLSSFQGRPLVISMVYTSCYHICPTVTRHLANVVAKAKQALGDKSFNVLTIGFDSPNDTPDVMRQFAAQQSVDSDNWQFLSADQAAINALAREIGFQFRASPKGFDHLIQATIVDAKGKVYRQVYDMNFATPMLIEPLKELLEGQPRTGSVLGHIGDKLRLFCTVYDPTNDRYFLDYSIFIGMFIGLTTMGVLIYYLFGEWRRTRRGAA